MFNDSNNLRYELLCGTEPRPGLAGTLPPPPRYSMHDHPQPPNTLFEAAAGPDAIFWIDAALKEINGHHSRPTYTVAPISVLPDYNSRNEKWHGLQGTWTFTYKWNPDGSLDKFKAREAIAAHKFAATEGIHYDGNNTYSSNAPVGELRNLEAIAVEKGFHVYELDVTQAFLQAPISSRPDGKPVTVRQPPGSRLFIANSGWPSAAQVNDPDYDYSTADHVVDGVHTTSPEMQWSNNINALETADVVHAAWYGFPTSGCDFAYDLDGKITGRTTGKAGINPLRMLRCGAQPCIYFLDDPDHQDVFYVLWCNTDNIRVYSSSTTVHTIFLNWFGATYPITGGMPCLQDQGTTTSVGIQFTYTPGKVELSMRPYITKLLTDYDLFDVAVPHIPMDPKFMVSKADRPLTDEEQHATVVDAAKLFPTATVASYKGATTLFRQILMAIAWYVTQCGPTERVAVAILAKAMQAPSTKAFVALRRLLAFTKSGLTHSIVYRKTQDWAPNDYPQLTFSSDSSFGNCPDTGKSLGGFVGGFHNQAATIWVGRFSDTVCLATYHGEQHFASQCSRDIVYSRNVLNEVGATQHGPTPLYVDNAATVLAANSKVRKFSKKNKHFNIQERYVIECCELGYVRVIKIPGQYNTADAMTKPLPRTAFWLHHGQIHYGTSSPSESGGGSRY